jgi:hypothetical protein
MRNFAADMTSENLGVRRGGQKYALFEVAFCLLPERNLCRIIGLGRDWVVYALGVAHTSVPTDRGDSPFPKVESSRCLSCRTVLFQVP